MAAPRDRVQFVPLVHNFVARFFENDLTASANDLKRSFFGLVAILGIPGALTPFMMSFTWELIGRFQGVSALRMLSRSDKDLYLGFTIVATMAVSALTWNTLLIDGRDAMVLGSLPVRPRTVVMAKLAALVVYVGALGVAMHTLSAVTWGACLDYGAGASFGLLFRGIVAHFVAGCMATAMTVFAVAGVQGVLMALVGPRLFARVSSLFQIALVLVLGTGIFLVPRESLAIVDAFRSPPAPGTTWALSMPAAWCLAVYERILGGALGSFTVLRHLATEGLATLGAVFVIAIASNALAFARVMRGAVELTTRSSPALGKVRQLVVRIVARRADGRATVDFLLTSIGRVERLRLALAVGIGVGVAWAVPVLRNWPTLAASSTPARDILTLPIALMVLWLTALRVAASLPADLRAAWVFDLVRPDAIAVRGLIERTWAVIGILPFALLGGGVGAKYWGVRLGLTHGEFIAAFGFLILELLLATTGAIPGTQPWRPERAELRSRWPFYLVGFLWMASGFPFVVGFPFYRGDRIDLEVAMLDSLAVSAFWILVLVAAALWVRHRAIHKMRTEPPVEEDEFGTTTVTVRLT